VRRADAWGRAPHARATPAGATVRWFTGRVKMATIGSAKPAWSVRRWRGASAALLLVTVGGLALAGCSSSAGSDGGSSALPPVIVQLDEVDGTTVQVDEGGSIDLTGDDDTYTDWSAEIADPSVVEFVPGRDDGSAQFNPGLTAKSVGKTEVTLDNSSSGDTVTFTVEVVAKSGY
jgi:hypothetical protein